MAGQSRPSFWYSGKAAQTLVLGSGHAVAKLVLLNCTGLDAVLSVAADFLPSLGYRFEATGPFVLRVGGNAVTILGLEDSAGADSIGQ